MNRQDAKVAKVATLREPSQEVDRLARAVIGAAIEVHRLLGPGFREATYEAALSVELSLRQIPHVRQAPVTLHYKGHIVGEGWLDILVADILVVELKAVNQLSDVHTAQVISYLRAIDQHLGLLLNFNSFPLTNGIRRVIAS